MSRIHKAKEGCPRYTSYNEPCAYDPSTGLCPAVMSIAAPCPFFQEADPDVRHGDDTQTPSPTDTAAAFASAFVKVTAKTVATAAAKEMLRQTPGTVQHLNMKLEEREEGKKQQDRTAQLLKWERQKRCEKILLGGGKVTLQRRPELSGYLQDQDCLWPQGEPIAALGILV